MTIQLPEYISYSQYNSYTQCPRSWYLSKIRKGEELQTWYIPIGTAVHQMIEEHIAGRGSWIEAEDYFYPLVSAQMEIEPDLSKWLAGGPKGAPVKERLALQLVKDCFEKALEFLEGMDVWEVELDASCWLPGLSVELKGFIDIVGEHRKHGPMILDWKTGSKKPGNFQLETYAAMLRSRYAATSFKGWYAMLAPGTANARPIDLSAVDPAEVGAKYQKVRTAMESMRIRAEKRFMCKMCFQSPNCAEYSGLNVRTMYYDRSRHDQPPF